jgi:hypothetical protein
MCRPMSPFCSRLIISNYILAQIVLGRSGSGRPPSAPSPDYRFFGETGAPCHCEGVQPARRKISAFNKEQT